MLLLLRSLGEPVEALPLHQSYRSTGSVRTTIWTADHPITPAIHHTYVRRGSGAARTWLQTQQDAGDVVISCSPGDAPAAGTQALLRGLLPAAPGSATATGVLAAVTGPAVSVVTMSHEYRNRGSVSMVSWTGDGLTALTGAVLACIPGDASAAVPAASLRATASVQAANAAAPGVTAQLYRIFGVQVGNAIAEGMQAYTSVPEVLEVSATDYYRKIATSIMTGHADGPSNNLFVRIARRRVH